MPRALFRCGQVMLLVALLSATGGQWVVLQSLAWSTMLVDFTRQGPWTEAVQKTFDGQHPCALCKEIEQGKKSEKKSDGIVLVSKMVLFHPPQAEGMVRTVRSWEWRVSESAATLRFEQPPLPPPRWA